MLQKRTNASASWEKLLGQGTEFQAQFPTSSPNPTHPKPRPQFRAWASWTRPAPPILSLQVLKVFLLTLRGSRFPTNENYICVASERVIYTKDPCSLSQNKYHYTLYFDVFVSHHVCTSRTIYDGLRWEARNYHEKPTKRKAEAMREAFPKPRKAGLSLPPKPPTTMKFFEWFESNCRVWFENAYCLNMVCSIGCRMV